MLGSWSLYVAIFDEANFGGHPISVTTNAEIRSGERLRHAELHAALNARRLPRRTRHLAASADKLFPGADLIPLGGRSRRL